VRSLDDPNVLDQLVSRLGALTPRRWGTMTAGEIAADLQGTGFEIVRAVERDPYSEVECQSRRSYVLARAS